MGFAAALKSADENNLPPSPTSSQWTEGAFQVYRQYPVSNNNPYRMDSIQITFKISDFLYTVLMPIYCNCRPFQPSEFQVTRLLRTQQLSIFETSPKNRKLLIPRKVSEPNPPETDLTLCQKIPPALTTTMSPIPTD